ncbi:rRNA-processing protein EBP2 [Fasciolopsis buskii]|uniref:rRNA-processing protein EBP2 n=1 Tax=Fasciolopsis buskii TaxID=27845 RepID=A0A8E0RWR4_9TREM|nr:rRNA-processing protein EBP2 [Fasciolopsis buski]
MFRPLHLSDSSSCALVNRSPALENTLRHIENNLPWVERLDIVTPPAPAPKELEVENDPEKIDADDDFKRENYFYRIGQAAVLKAIPQLHALGVPTKRPVDFFAEMVKSDEHMGKVKKHLVETQQRLALRERARQMREKRKFGKQTQLAVLQARKAEKRRLTEAIKASRKKSGHNQADLLDSILSEFRDEHEPKLNQKKAETKQTGFHRAKDIANRRKINRQRDYKNKKYGHGGQKKRSKRNTRDSFGMGLKRDFDPSKHQNAPKKVGRMKAKGGGLKMKHKRSQSKRRR